MKAFRETLGGIGLLFGLSVIGVHYEQLPQQIATHFNWMGMPDRTGSKETLLWVALLSVVIYGMMSLISLLPPSRAVNWHQPVTPEQRLAMGKIAMTMLAWVKVEVAWILAGLSVMMVRIGLGKQGAVPLWFIPMMMVVLFGTIGFYMMRVVRASQTD